MSDPTSNSTRWGIVLGMALALFLAYLLRYVLLPFVAAGALAYVARPLVTLLYKRLGWPRWLSALVPFLLFLLILSALGFAVQRLLAPHLVEMLNNSQKMMAALLEHIFKQFNLQDVRLFGRKLDPDQSAAALLDLIKQTSGANVLFAIGGFIGLMMGCVMTIVLFAFILFTGPHIARGMLWLVPPTLRPRIGALVLEIDPMLGDYLRGVLVIVLFTACATYFVTSFLFHVPHPIFLALAVGLLELIPVVGPILSFLVFGLLAIQQSSIESIIGFGVFAIVLRLTIDQLMAPLVLGRAARIPAIVVIFSFLAGGALYGMLGVILAIPVAATIKIVLTDIYEGTPQSGDRI